MIPSQALHHCGSCHQDKPAEAFSIRRRSRTGLQPRCKACAAIHFTNYYANDDVKERIRWRNDRMKDRNRRYVLDYLQTHPCINCGESDPLVLEFDHRDASAKIASISVLIQGNSLESIQTEISKCDVRCANCHRRKTAIEFGWFRALEEAESQRE